MPGPGSGSTEGLPLGLSTRTHPTFFYMLSDTLVGFAAEATLRFLLQIGQGYNR